MKPSIIPNPQIIRYTGGSADVNTDTEIYTCVDKAIKPEGYRLTIANDGIHMSFSDDTGEFYARQTLRQIIETCGGDCDKLEIEDFPSFNYRGFSLDCCRHFFTVNETEKIIDMAALLKMNRFHWHLTDDQGWRLPIEKYPLLTQIGSKRSNSNFRNLKESGEYAYSYTRAEIDEIVSYCAERKIEVIPEIDMPGHTSALLAAYPQLGCTGKKVAVKTKEGIFEDVICPAKAETPVIIKDIIDEVCEMFPGQFIHIGGDETPHTHWKSCPDCKKEMKALGTDDFNRYQGLFIKAVANYVKSKGKTAITWNESLKGDALEPGNVTVQRWLEKGNLTADFVSKGGKVIECDYYHYYCDYPYGMTPVKKTYGYNPYEKYTSRDGVLGIEAEIWAEFINNFDDLCYKYFPRFTAVAERAWSGNAPKDFENFQLRHESLRQLFISEGITPAPVSDWNPDISSRLIKTARFFKGALNKDLIKNAINNLKSGK